MVKRSVGATKKKKVGTGLDTRETVMTASRPAQWTLRGHRKR